MTEELNEINNSNQGAPTNTNPNKKYDDSDAVDELDEMNNEGLGDDEEFDQDSNNGDVNENEKEWEEEDGEIHPDNEEMNEAPKVEKDEM